MSNTISQDEPENTGIDEAVAGYLNHLAKLWNIESIQGNADQIHNAKKIIFSIVDPRNTWFTRTKQGLRTDAAVTILELEEVFALNKSTFMTAPNGKITLRLKMLNLSLNAITYYYKLDES